MSPHAMSASSSFLSWSFPSRAGVGHCAWSNAALVYRRCTCKGIDESAPRSTLAERPSHVQDYSALRFSLVAEYSGDCTERRKSACSLVLVGSRTGRSSRSVTAPRDLSVIAHPRRVSYPAKGLRDGSSGGALQQVRPSPAHHGSGLRFQCPGLLRLNRIRAETDWEGPPCVPHSVSALWTCDSYSIRPS